MTDRTSALSDSGPDRRAQITSERGTCGGVISRSGITGIVRWAFSALPDVVILAVAVATLYWGCSQWRDLIADDAFIHFRYARNLAEGLGPVFNPDERVEGYTSILWVGGMALAMLADLEPSWFARRVSFVSAVAIVILLYRGLVRAGVVGWGAALTTLLFSSCIVVTSWTMAGMETLAFSLLLFAGLLGLALWKTTPLTSFTVSLLLMLATLTRPEAGAIWVGGLALVWVRIGRAALPCLVAYAAPGLLQLAYLAFRWTYFGDLLPNTYYAKLGGEPLRLLGLGLDELRLFAAMPGHVAWFLMATLGSALGARRFGQGRVVVVMAAAVGFYFVYVTMAGGDSLGGYRFYVPVLAPLAFLAGLLFHERASGWLRAMAVLGIASVSFGVHAWFASEDRSIADIAYLEGNIKLGKYLREHRSPDTLIAVSAGGAIPYYSRLRTLDLYGLTDKHIARQPFARERAYAGHMKWDSEYALSREPDIFVVNRGYFRAGDPALERGMEHPLTLMTDPMEKDLFGHLLWNDDYELRPIRFDDGSHFFVFERVAPRSSGIDDLVPETP